MHSQNDQIHEKLILIHKYFTCQIVIESLDTAFENNSYWINYRCGITLIELIVIKTELIRVC